MRIVWQPGVELEVIEREVIEAALRYFANNKQQAADSLGVSVRTIHNKIKKWKEDDEAKARYQKQLDQKAKDKQSYLSDLPRGFSEAQGV